MLRQLDFCWRTLAFKVRLGLGARRASQLAVCGLPQRWVRDASGVVAVAFALAFILVVNLTGLAIDYARVANERAWLQQASDAGALAGAKELSLADANRENVPDVVQATVASYVRASQHGGGGDVSIETVISNDPLEVRVKGAHRVNLAFGGLFGASSTDVEAVSVAKVVGKPNICVLAMDGKEPATFSMAGAGRLTGNNCAIFSNSTSPLGFTALVGTSVKASTICSAGGVTGGAQLSPPPYDDCPQFDDPLSDRPEPVADGCDYVAKVIAAGIVTLRPGTYCGGLTITGLSRVSFDPGIYVIKDGPFLVAGSAEIKGDGVGFFLTGSAFFTFDPLTAISLSAPRSGPMAGLLFFGSRSQSLLLANTILSSRAHVMTGTVYLPRTQFVVDSLAQIGSQSAYTAIVARRVVVAGTPDIVLNAKYSDTDVPVPAGIKSAGRPASLSK